MELLLQLHLSQIHFVHVWNLDSIICTSDRFYGPRNYCSIVRKNQGMNLINLPASPSISKTIEPGLYQPAISIILPFEPKMVPKSELVDQLKGALETVHRHVAKSVQNDSTALVMQKLRKVVRNLNFSTYTKSIAIYLSPVLEKVLYLDITVKPKVTVNEPLDIRDLVLAKKQTRQYLVVHINEFSSNIYRADGEKLTKIKSNILYSDQKTRPLSLKKISNATDQRLKGISQISDQGLIAILQAYPLPVFVVGSRNAVSYFKQNTSVKQKILEYLDTNEDLASEKDIENVIKPLVVDWDNVQQKYLRQLLENAKSLQNLATGIGNVWKMASKWTGSLLMVEENYRHTEQLLESEEGLYTSKEPYSRYSHIRNSVDYIIEIVLENGGDVEFIKQELFEDCKHIALVRR